MMMMMMMFWWRVFRILTEPVPSTFASANRRSNDEARAHVAMWFRYNMEKSPRNVRGFYGYFSQCTVSQSVNDLPVDPVNDASSEQIT